MQYRREHVGRINEEIEKLVKDYFASTPAGKDMPELKFKWDMYDQLDKHGALLLVTARGEETKELCGFVMYHIQPHMHHDTVVALCDIIAVSPQFRGQGIGAQLISLGEQFTKAQGVSQIVHGFRLDYTEGVVPIFQKLEYQAKETWYVKDLR
jgi:GNAT superfamily N-acetyltransferase